MLYRKSPELEVLVMMHTWLVYTYELVYIPALCFSFFFLTCLLLPFTEPPLNLSNQPRSTTIPRPPDGVVLAPYAFLPFVLLA